MQTVSVPMEQLVQLLAVQLEKGQAPLRVTGSSMHPILRDQKDTVYLQTPRKPLKKGDVILYRRDNGVYVLHRIVKCRGEERYICSGDNQFVPEEVFGEQVLAVVDTICRGGKVIPVGHIGYRAFVWLWVLIFPVRRPILALRRYLAKLRRRRIKRNNT